MSGRSSRTWVIGQGHLSLPDARRWALEQVEQREAEFDAAQAEFAAADSAMRAAMQERTRKQEARDKAKDALDAARADLAYRAGPAAAPASTGGAG